MFGNREIKPLQFADGWCIFREKTSVNSKQTESTGKFSKITKCSKSLNKQNVQATRILNKDSMTPSSI